MKLVFCNDCHDMFVLKRKRRVCECGRTSGVYATKDIAVVTGPCRPMIISNEKFGSALLRSGDWSGFCEFEAWVVARNHEKFRYVEEGQYNAMCARVRQEEKNAE